MSKDKEARLRMTVNECYRFIEFAARAFMRNKLTKETFYSSREMGQVKRASIDLSQKLVAFRKPDGGQ